MKKHTFVGILLSVTVTTANTQTFAPLVSDPFNLTGLGGMAKPALVDLDADGDLDLVTGSDYGNWGASLNYFENIGTATAPHFAAGIPEAFGSTYIGAILSPTFVDMDNDGDFDMVVGNQSGETNYYENIGTATNFAFAAPVNSDPFNLWDIGYLSSHTFADLDNDGDQDALIGEYYGPMYYFQNIGTASAPNFGPYQTLPFGLSNVGLRPKPTFRDMDGDGDFDVMVGLESGNHVYFQNTGTASAPAFTAPVSNPFGLTATMDVYSAPTFGDLDYDGDDDILCTDNSNIFNYFENTSPVPIPPAPTTTLTAQDLRICYGTGAVLTASGVPTGTIGWYDAPTGGNWIGGGTPFVTNPITATTTLYIQDSTNGGPSPSRTPVTLTVTQPITDQPVEAANSVFCVSGSTQIDLTSTESGTKYSLINALTGDLVDGPQTGNGSGLSFNTGTIDTTTHFQVIAEKGFPYDNQALEFVGTNQYVLAPAAIDLANQSFTIEFWAKRIPNGGDNYIIGQHVNQSVNNALHIGFRSGNSFTFAFYGNDLDVFSPATTDGILHHWACVYQANQAGTNRFIYLDGVLIGSDAAGNYTGNGPLHIGTGSFSASSFNGTLDELRIWNTARTPAEVEQDMLENCLSGTETGLLAYYKMNETGGTLMHDQTSNGYHGTLMNMNPAAVWVPGTVQSACMQDCQRTLSQTATVTINQPITHTENVSLCPGEDYTYADGTTVNAVMTAESHLTVFTGMASNGCDSILTENLIILPVPVGSVTATICYEENITVNGTVYDASNPTGTEIFPNAGANGCDSVVTISLNVLPFVETTLTNSICATDSILVNGNVYNASNLNGVEVFLNATANGCDSTVYINLSVLPALESTITATICAEESITVNGTVYDVSNPSGTEVFSNAGVNGCDSTVTVNLTFLPALSGTYSPIVCYYDSIVFNGTTYNSLNPFGTEVLTGANGCDSIVTVNLLIPAINTFTTLNGTTITALPGYTYQWIDCSTNQPISGATSQSFTATSNGSYAVILNQEGCLETSPCTDITTVGMNEFGKSLLSVSPNPTETDIHVSGLETLNGIQSISILDLNGKQINTVLTTDSTYDVSALESGMYYLKIIHENGTEMIRFIKK